MNHPPPIIAYHVVFGAYGFWLPNDPRGSWSRYVWADRLKPFGSPRPISASHETPLSHRLQAETRRVGTAAKLHQSKEQDLRQRMKEELCYPAVRFSGVQARAVARGFAAIIHRLGMVVHAAALMPDHVHLVVARQEMYAETIAGYLKRAAARQLRKENLHPLAAYVDGRRRLPSPWEEHGWKVFLHTPKEIELAMEYVNNNPVEAGLPPQRWS